MIDRRKSNFGTRLATHFLLHHDLILRGSKRLSSDLEVGVGMWNTFHRGLLFRTDTVLVLFGVWCAVFGHNAF